MKKQVPTAIKKRIVFVSAMFAVMTIVMIIRLGYVQIVMGSFLQGKALEQHTRDRLISPN